MKEKDGALIVFEGADGTGKSTLTSQIENKLNQKNIDTERIHFPGSKEGTLGYLINELHHNMKSYGIDNIDNTSLQLLHIAAHIDSIERRIIPWLKSNKTVLLDRYWWSTWVYGQTSGAKSKSLKMMVDIEKNHWGDIVPDHLIFLHNSRKNNNKYLRKHYEKLISEENNKYPITKIDTADSIKKSLEKITKTVFG